MDFLTFVGIWNRNRTPFWELWTFRRVGEKPAPERARAAGGGNAVSEGESRRMPDAVLAMPGAFPQGKGSRVRVRISATAPMFP
jgi:hypothetical protein